MVVLGSHVSLPSKAEGSRPMLDTPMAVYLRIQSWHQEQLTALG